MDFDDNSKEIIASKKEAKWTIIIYFIYFLWSICSAYGLGSKNPDEYTYILGFPAWFFYSCILSYPLACLAVYILIKKVFK